MDVYCCACGEPWDSYGMRHGDMGQPEAKRFMAGEGCPCCEFGLKAPKSPPPAAIVAQAAREVCGEDEDGVAAMCDDFSSFGG
jgi:hypothetical protein